MCKVFPLTKSFMEHKYNAIKSLCQRPVFLLQNSKSSSSQFLIFRHLENNKEVPTSFVYVSFETWYKQMRLYATTLREGAKLFSEDLA